ncbi:MAG: xylulokinase [Anaerolineae bacterium]
MDYMLGMDIGTSGAKAAIVDTDGNLLGVGRHEYSIATPRPGWAEQDPAIWIEAAVSTTREALAESNIRRQDIAAIGLSGQMHTTVCLDRGGVPLRPAITWADQRTGPQVREVYGRLGREGLARWTQNPLATGFTLANLLWLQENEPAIYAAIAHVLLPKDYLRYYLTGEIGTEATDASGTSLMDVKAGAWNSELLAAFGIAPAILPAIQQSTSVAGSLRAEVASVMGLRPGIPVAYGSADQPAQAVGNGIIHPGVLSSTIGTGGQLQAPSATPSYDPELRLHTFCHAVPNLWYNLAAILTAGLAFAWLRRVLHAESYGALADAAAQVAPGADGLFFLPYLAGERTPHMNPAARGVFVGLTLRHDQAHLARAVMEGVVFSLRQGLELIKSLGVPVDRVIASGGSTRHPLWLQLQADIYNQAIYQTRTSEAAAFGAALLGGVGAGIFASLDAACAATVRMSDVIVQPSPANVTLYDKLYQQYVELYPALSSQFRDSA